MAQQFDQWWRAMASARQVLTTEEIAQEAWDDGRSDGYNTGYHDGRSDGYNTGYHDGRDEGLTESACDWNL
jgi:flagellar biosynthesis/type III secretory pathway protein FliH